MGLRRRVDILAELDSGTKRAIPTCREDVDNEGITDTGRP